MDFIRYVMHGHIVHGCVVHDRLMYVVFQGLGVINFIFPDWLNNCNGAGFINPVTIES